MYKDNDPTMLKAKEKAAEVAKAAANRWTDNIFSIQSYCAQNFMIDQETFCQQFQLPADLDSLPWWSFLVIVINILFTFPIVCWNVERSVVVVSAEENRRSVEWESRWTEAEFDRASMFGLLSPTPAPAATSVAQMIVWHLATHRPPTVHVSGASDAPNADKCKCVHCPQSAKKQRAFSIHNTTGTCSGNSRRVAIVSPYQNMSVSAMDSTTLNNAKTIQYMSHGTINRMFLLRKDL